MINKIYLFLGLVFWFAQAAYTQVFPIYQSMNPNNKSNLQEEEKGRVWKESKAERTLTSSQFMDEKGNTKSVYSKKNIHYRTHTGSLEPISPLLRPLPGQGWAALEQDNPTYLFYDFSYGVSLGAGQILQAGQSVKINGKPFNYGKDALGMVTPKGINYASNGIERQLLFSEDRVKSNVVLSASLDSKTQYTEVSERLTLPKGYGLKYVSANTNIEDTEPNRRRAGLMFIDGFAHEAEIWIVRLSDQSPVGKIFTPIIYDANQQWTAGLMRFEELDDHVYEFTVALANEWLNDKARAYPVTIDPLIGGPTATWVGGQMPSCFLPISHVDSLLATIPGSVTVTGLYVSSSFYADPFSGATMSQGSMYFSTSCGVSQTFTVVGSTAQFAGTAYLDSFNVMSPLACCVPESCNPTQIYVRFHLGRTAFNGNCNTFYIRYDPFTTSWPFQVVIYGKTPESYGSIWYAAQTPLCSNNCEVSVKAYARYGVAPYTFSHPWTTEVVTTGTNVGCNAGSTNHQFTLTIPNCPVYCDSTYTLLTIPPPIIVDACGTVITGLPNETVPIKPATNVVLQYDSIVCSGPLIDVGLSSCLDNGTAYFFGEGLSGQGNFSTVATTSGAPISLSFSAYAEGNGCASDTTDFNITVHSNPIAAFTVSPNPIVVGVPAVFIDNSASPASTINAWSWFWNDTLTSLSSQWGNTYFNPGNNTLCLFVQDAIGCLDSICQVVPVVPASVNLPNVITPNGNGTNDLLVFQYLEFYPDNQLKILNRWGNVLYEKSGYQNDWSGSEYNDGTYYYILTIQDKQETYTGFFHLIK